VDEGDIRDVVNGLGIPNASVTRFGGADSHEFLIKFRGERETEAAAVEEDEAEAAPEPVAGEEADAEAGPQEGDVVEDPEKDRVWLLQETLEKVIGPLEVQRVEFVGPKVGAELREAGVKAMVIACVLILVYIGFRFSTRFAPGAVVALIHDVSITASIWILLGLEFDLRVLAALLAIIGYSLNDTIIVYDRIRENMESREHGGAHQVRLEGGAEPQRQPDPLAHPAHLPHHPRRGAVASGAGRGGDPALRPGDDDRDPGGDLLVDLHRIPQPAVAGDAFRRWVQWAAGDRARSSQARDSQASDC
jgi:preprotein translocase SecF subunit